jgi:hypothetical protein
MSEPIAARHAAMHFGVVRVRVFAIKALHALGRNLPFAGLDRR